MPVGMDIPLMSSSEMSSISLIRDLRVLAWETTRTFLPCGEERR